MNIIEHVGKYTTLVYQALQPAEKKKVYYQQIIYEMYELGIKSIPFVAFVSIFVGAILTLQTSANIKNPLIPKYLVGFATRESIMVEFSPTIISLLLAGKIGSNIASGIGTMRVTEQIDALEIMGVNSAGYLIYPKIVALMLINPFIISLSIIIGVGGGWLAALMTGSTTYVQFIEGIQWDFNMMKYIYAMVKTILFAFLLQQFQLITDIIRLEVH
uniref:UPF0393 membrane protein RBE_1340 n=1 Tax=Lepeophtheirus salmonis TaxID=72036 RepID=C1BSW2_LEPSM|nr:UPF0393 membrane protein RBE_1340 [Lepeophtheirus salmonis]